MTYREAQKRAKELCTPNFLATLVQVGRLYGPIFGEEEDIVMEFIDELHALAGLPIPLPAPIVFDEDQESEPCSH